MISYKGLSRLAIVSLFLVLCAISAGCYRNDITSDRTISSVGYAINAESSIASFDLGRGYGGNFYDSTLHSIVKNGNITLDTRDFDGLTSFINDFILSVNGFIESSNFYKGNDELRTINYSLRVPENSFDVAINVISSNGIIRHSSQSETNVTNQHFDILTRLEIKEAEEKRLQDLVNEASDISDLITLEQQLSTVRADIELLRTRLREMERSVSYAMIWLNISEIIYIYDTGTLWNRLRKAFIDSIENVITFAQSALVFLASAIIPVLLIVLMFLVGRFAYCRLTRRRKYKNRKSLSKRTVDKKAPEAVKLDKLVELDKEDEEKNDL